LQYDSKGKCKSIDSLLGWLKLGSREVTVRGQTFGPESGSSGSYAEQLIVIPDDGTISLRYEPTEPAARRMTELAQKSSKLGSNPSTVRGSEQTKTARPKEDLDWLLMDPQNGFYA
jgi:hypothetical protein